MAAARTAPKKSKTKRSKSNEVVEPASKPARKRGRAKKSGTAEDDEAQPEKVTRSRKAKARENASEADEQDAPPAKKKRGSKRGHVDLAQALLQAAATNERMNQYLLEYLDEAAWRMPSANKEGRTIAAIVAHMHNVRHMWLVVAGKEFEAPEKVDRRTLTREEAMKALAASNASLRGLFERSLEAGGKVKDFKPDIVGFLAYIVSHEAHHRGQICMLARMHGFPLSKDAGYGMWDWGKRTKECEIVFDEK